MKDQGSVCADVECSVVIPCLNEADTLEACVVNALDAMRRHNIHGEVVVADNGSTDDSARIAERCGARVVSVPSRGYGAAIQGGVDAALGRFIIMGDADDSYDFGEIPRFVEELRKGAQLVMGCRLPAGGGRVERGAMPFLHRWIGNPVFSLMARVMFHAPINDVNCGMRGFARELYDRLKLRCTGMEFAPEMVIKSSLFNASIAEIPITLRPDKRRSHAPHLRTFADGWRTLRFYLMYSPKWVFFWPGCGLMVTGVLAWLAALFRVQLGQARLDVHTMLFGSLFLICGYQSILFGVSTTIFGVNEGLLPDDLSVSRLVKRFPLERCLILSGCVMLVGICMLAWTFWHWHALGYGDLDYERTLRVVIPGVTLASLGFQTMMSSMFLGILGLKRR